MRPHGNCCLLTVFLVIGCGQQAAQTGNVAGPNPQQGSPDVHSPAPGNTKTVPVAPAKSVDDLIQELKDSSPEVRKQAATALGQLGNKATAALPALHEATKDPQREVRGAAVEALPQIRADAETITIILAALDQDDYVRRVAEGSLEKVVPDATAAPVLAQSLKNPNARLRKTVVGCLERMGPAAADAVPDLTGVLHKKEEDAGIRESAARALGNVGDKARPAVPELLRALEDTNPGVVTASKEAALKLCKDKELLPVLEQALRGPNDKPRHFAAEALARIGAPSVPILTAAMDDRNDTVREDSIDALARIGTPIVVPALLAAIKDKDTQVRVRAIKGLNHAKADKTAIPALIEALNDEDDGVRNLAAEQLASYKEDALPALIKVVATETEEKPLISAAHALGKIGPPAKSALPKLRPLLKDASDDVKSAAKAAMDRIDPETK